MPLYNEESFELQRLYEKWVVKKEWLLINEALPLLLGYEPGLPDLNADLEKLQSKVNDAVKNGDLTIIKIVQGDDVVQSVKPEIIYQWAMSNRLKMPPELVNLMEFVLMTVKPASADRLSDQQAGYVTGNADIEKLLGACLSVVSNFSEECKNKKGQVSTEKILKVLDREANSLFGTEYPDLSSTAIRDIINHWILKLR